MGVSIAASAKNSGHEVLWASTGRSAQTLKRAVDAGLTDVGAVAELCRRCSILLCVCPPDAAEDVADLVIGQGFRGIYADCNAISPAWAQLIGDKVNASGATFVDGGIVGGPAWEPGNTWLYLSGPLAGDVAAVFSAGPLETSVIGRDPGKASALKMCYAAYTKGSTALLTAIVATAHQLGVWTDLKQQWERDWPGMADQAVTRARRVTAKAWRFAGEMEEISATFDQAGLPGGFHAAAADLYRRLARFKAQEKPPSLDAVLAALQTER
jgi:3-hydroxyisobutyrate dehydrogenase-like beta-hydroxyacid dehydrogenase